MKAMWETPMDVQEMKPATPEICRVGCLLVSGYARERKMEVTSLNYEKLKCVKFEVMGRSEYR
jgi:hypothetical protein